MRLLRLGVQHGRRSAGVVVSIFVSALGLGPIGRRVVPVFWRCGLYRRCPLRVAMGSECGDLVLVVVCVEVSLCRLASRRRCLLASTVLFDMVGHWRSKLHVYSWKSVERCIRFRC